MVSENASEKIVVEIFGLKRHQVHSFPTGVAGGSKEWTRVVKHKCLGNLGKWEFSISFVQVFFNCVAISKGKTVKLSQHLRQKLTYLGPNQTGHWTWTSTQSDLPHALHTTISASQPEKPCLQDSPSITLRPCVADDIQSHQSSSTADTLLQLWS